MPYPIQWLLSLIFIIQMYAAMLVVGVLYFIPALFKADYALAACHAYCRWVLFSLRVLCRLEVEVRGTPPTEPALVAAKHQSFLDILVIFGAIPRGRFIMKRELIYAPVLGWFGLRIGCIPVNRGKRGLAVTKMLSDVKSGVQRAGQLIIYSQGTRVAPGVKKPYKVGTAVLYSQLKQPCYPVATNVGVFWPKRGIYRKPGRAVVDFLPPMPPGMTNDAFMAKLEADVEAVSEDLLVEAGFKPKAD
jgi:1-acyl-sn-glycerol-3-phosphate acyltransferase